VNKSHGDKSIFNHQNKPPGIRFFPSDFGQIATIQRYRKTLSPQSSPPRKVINTPEKVPISPIQNLEQFPAGSWHGTLDSIFIIFIGKHLGATRLIVGHKIGDQTVSLIGTHVGTLEANRFSTGLENHISATDKIFRSRRADDGP